MHGLYTPSGPLGAPRSLHEISHAQLEPSYLRGFEHGSAPTYTQLEYGATMKGQLGQATGTSTDNKEVVIKLSFGSTVHELTAVQVRQRDAVEDATPRVANWSWTLVCSFLPFSLSDSSTTSSYSPT